MNLRRVSVLARRVMRQVWRDHRTVGLLLFGPMLVLWLGSLLFRTDPPVIPLGVVNEDKGLTVPMMGKVALGERIVEELIASDAFEVDRKSVV